MRGDRLVIRDEHRKAARQIAELLLPEIAETPGRFAISVAGESGAGKSEIAAVLAEILTEEGFTSAILQQDDYFVHPPKTNAEMRAKNINHVGVSEVHLDVMDQNLKDFLEGKKAIEKPLVIFEQDRITKETLELEDTKVLIAEGTYTTLLENTQKYVFIDRNYLDTRKVRKLRAREAQDDLLEKILKIEHRIISSHKPKAHIIVTKNYEAVKAEEVQ